ncbi:MAG: cyclase family protein [Oscillospiraceae bacterium]|nr:cyclase family protein [Oscillospiraceae bacterium]
MKIFDISQEVFDCTVFPGDPKPVRKVMLQVKNGDVCNLTAIKMCAHNGTHVDAPYHFIDDAKAIGEIPLESYVGYAYVCHHDGDVTESDAISIIKNAKKLGDNCEKRILIGGKATVTEEAAKVFAGEKLLLVGNESQTVGPENAPKNVHMILLGAEVTLLEGIRLSDVPDGKYLLNCAPLNLGGADGAPCRAILIDMEA